MPFLANYRTDSKQTDPVTQQLIAAIGAKNPLSYGRAPAIAYSGRQLES